MAHKGGCDCENAPFLRNRFCSVDYAMCIAPRPLFLAASDGDWTKLSETVEFPIVKSLYDLYGKSENFECFFRSAPHCYERCTRERVYDFFCRAFGGVRRRFPDPCSGIGGSGSGILAAAN